MVDEGAIKFHAEHRDETLSARRFGELVCQLVAWREILALTRLVGQEPALYGGFGYGNVSGRTGAPGNARGRRSFLITGTQTSGRRCVGLEDFCRVESYDEKRNRVVSRGAVLPSSESMTHGAIYDLGPHIRFVFHAHSAVIWQRARELRLPTTDAAVPYGTPEMAREVARLSRTTALLEKQILAMGGHEDGILAFGRSAEEAGQVLVAALARAYEASCATGVPGLCVIPGESAKS